MSLSDDAYRSHVRELRDALRSAPAHLYTHRDTSPERDAARQAIVDDAWSELGGDDIPKGRQGLILGGLPGSGKTQVRSSAEVPGVGPVASHFLPIDADYFKGKLIDAGLAPSLPGFAPMETAPLMHKESNDLAKALARRAYGEGTNIAWDYTLRHPHSPDSRMTEFGHYGYTPHGIYVHADPAVALARTKKRHRDDLEAYLDGRHPHGGRYVPPEIIGDSVHGDRIANRDNYDRLARHLATSQIFDTTSGTHRTARRTAMPTWYHLTDDPDFHLDPDRVPTNYNYPDAGAGVFLTQRPHEWADNEWGEDRDYIADIDAPDDLHTLPGVRHDPDSIRPTDKFPGSDEIFVPDHQFHHLTVQRVRPRTAAADEHPRDEWGNRAYPKDKYGNPDYGDDYDLDEYMYGQCASYAVGHQAEYPHLRFGIDWENIDKDHHEWPSIMVEDEGLDPDDPAHQDKVFRRPQHIFTHDDHWAYDASGAYPVNKIQRWDDLTLNHSLDDVEGTGYVEGGPAEPEYVRKNPPRTAPPHTARRTAEFSSQPLNITNDYSMAAFFQWCAHNRKQPTPDNLAEFAAVSGMNAEDYIDNYLFLARGG